MLTQSTTQPEGIPIVLGGGGMRGASLLGFLDFLEDEGVICQDFTGVSIGSIVAAFYTNGYSTKQIRQVFIDELCKPSWTLMWQSLIPPVFNPLRMFCGGFVNMVPFMTYLVEKFGLKTRDNLRIIAFDLLAREPVVFEGHDFPLEIALTASCAVPGMVRPVPYEKDGRHYMLVDGGVYHPQPGKFCNTPAIIAKLIDIPGMQLLFPDRREDFIASVGDPQSRFFTRLTNREVDQLHQYGYTMAKDSLCVPIRRGDIPVALAA
jgi:predicted acylesterase/phospholipase RssA